MDGRSRGDAAKRARGRNAWYYALVPYMLLSLAVLSWAGNWVVGRAMRQEMGPVAMGFWRWSLALISWCG